MSLSCSLLSLTGSLLECFNIANGYHGNFIGMLKFVALIDKCLVLDMALVLDPADERILEIS